MIVHSDSTPVAEPSTAAVAASYSPLSAADLYQLTLYKWRYSLEAFGFERDEVPELMFLKWLYACHRIEP